VNTFIKRFISIISLFTNFMFNELVPCFIYPSQKTKSIESEKPVLSRGTNRFICVTSLQVKNYAVRVRIVHVAIPGCPG